MLQHLPPSQLYRCPGSRVRHAPVPSGAAGSRPVEKCPAKYRGASNAKTQTADKRIQRAYLTATPVRQLQQLLFGQRPAWSNASQGSFNRACNNSRSNAGNYRGPACTELGVGLAALTRSRSLNPQFLCLVCSAACDSLLVVLQAKTCVSPTVRFCRLQQSCW